MKSLSAITAAAVLCVASLPAHAIQTDIQVWADIDTTLALLKADGSPLPDAVRLDHSPATGLMPWSEQVRVFSNDTDKDVEIRLASDAALIPIVTAPGAVPVPLLVTLNRRPLTVAAQDFKSAELFDGAIPGASISMALGIAQAKQEKITAAGRYEGIVSVVMAQKTTSP